MEEKLSIKVTIASRIYPLKIDREEEEGIKLFDITAFPLRGVKLEDGYSFLSRTLRFEFEAKYAGEYLVKFHFVRDGALEIAAIEIILAQARKSLC